MTFQFIAAHRDEYRVSRMCEVLGVSSSGFYAWQDRKPSIRDQENAALVIDIWQGFDLSRQTYGSLRIHAEQAMSWSVSRKRVSRLMRIHGIQAKRKQRYKTTTKRNASVDPAPNLIAQGFNAQVANDKWVADITCIDTREGWLYLATILDVFSRKIVGWSMSERLKKHLVEDALRMAVGQRDLRGGLVYHSDQGSQYTSHDFLALL